MDDRGNDSSVSKGFLDAGRRKFLMQGAGSACAAGAVSLGLMAHVRSARALPAQALRPPGALPEAAFDSACVRCGLCVRACPFATLNLAPAGGGIPVGTPYFVSPEQSARPFARAD